MPEWLKKILGYIRQALDAGAAAGLWYSKKPGAGQGDDRVGPGGVSK